MLARHVRNRRLYDAIDHWALCAISFSPGARAFYDHRRAAGDLHHQALRAHLTRRAVVVPTYCDCARARAKLTIYQPLAVERLSH